MSINFNILADFLEAKVALNSLVVLVGDHQPPALVAGKKQPWTVPIHILSQNPARLAPFLERGYDPGLRPSAEGYAYMADFYRDFVEAFDGRPGS